MKIRSASKKDFKILYKIGKNTPEFKVSSSGEFMQADEFMWSITNKDSIFLVAEEGNKVCGFIYAHTNDVERSFKHKYACIVYLVVLPEFRRRGVAMSLYSECERRLRKLGITHIYCWASIESGGEMVKFMKRLRFVSGHRYIWMDRKIGGRKV